MFHFPGLRFFEKTLVVYGSPHYLLYHDYYTFKENTQGIERNPQCVSKPYQWFNSKSNNLRSIKWVPKTNNNIDCNSWNWNCYEKGIECLLKQTLCDQSAILKRDELHVHQEKYYSSLYIPWTVGCKIRWLDSLYTFYSRTLKCSIPFQNMAAVYS